MKKLVLSLCVAGALAACSSANDPRYLIAATPAERVKNLSTRTVEVQLVSLPSYASASDIVSEGDGGALYSQERAQWADDPARGMSVAIARGLSDRTGAAVAVEPWPLNTPADARLDVRIDQSYARADGLFELSGQYAVSSPDGRVREFVKRFHIETPVTEPGPAAAARALSAALAELSRQVAVSM
ncbi:MAG: ABC-type transport auxiliary lipoprotein family protein [Epibacterium sp.]